MTTTPWPKAICFFRSRFVARAGRSLLLSCAWRAPHGNILALLVALCGSPLAYYSFACGGIPFVPYASRWVWVRHACLLCFCTCVLFFLVVVCSSPRESRPSCLASFMFPHTILLARGGGGLVARAAVCTGGHTLPPFRLLRKRACGRGVSTSRLRLVVTFYICWCGCRSYLVLVA